MIKVEKLEYKNRLSNVSFEINSGQITALVGPNGSGKTTLFKCLVGLVKFSNGNLKYNERNFYSNKYEILAKVGSIIETPSLYTHLTLIENLTYFSRLKPNVLDSEVENLIHVFNLDPYRNTISSKLSMGTKQKLGLAISLLGDPEIIIWDEPTNSLDPLSIHLLKKIIVEKRDEGKTIIISSHNMNDVLDISDHILLLNAGSISYSNKTTNLLESIPYKINFIISDLEKFRDFSNDYNINLISKTDFILESGDRNLTILSNSNKHGFIVKNISKDLSNWLQINF